MISKNIITLTVLYIITISISGCSGGKPSNNPNNQSTINNNLSQANALYSSNIHGLVFRNNSLINGTGYTTTLDYQSISKVLKDHNNNIYASTLNGNVWKYDQSDTWTMMAGSPVPDNSDILDMLITDNGQLIVGTLFGDVYTVIDNKWVQLGGQASPNSSYITAMTAIGNDLYVGTYAAYQHQTGQVYLVTDKSWTQQGTNPINGSSVTSLNNYNNQLYIGSSNGNLFKLTDNNWQNTGSSLDGGAIITLTRYNDDMFIGTSLGNIYLAPLLSNSPWQQLTTQAAPDNGMISGIAINNNGIVFVTTNNMMQGIGNIYTISDNSWNLYSNKPDNFSGGINSLLLDGDKVIIGSANGSVYKIDNNSWSYQGGNASPDNASIYASASSGSTLFVGTSIGNVYAITPNSGWRQLGNGLSPDNSPIYSISISDSGNVYASTYGTSSNSFNANSNHFKQVNYNKYQTLTTINSNSSSSGGSIYKVTGNSWTQIGNSSSPDNSAVYSISVMPHSDDIIAGTQNNSVYLVNKNGWTQLGGGSNSNNYSSVFSITVCPNGNIYAASGSGVYLVNNTWNSYGKSPDASFVYVVYCNPTDNQIFAGTSTGMVYSISTDKAWNLLASSTIDGSLNSSAVYSIVEDPNTNTLYASTQSTGIWAYQKGFWINTNYNNGATVYSIALSN